MKLLIIARGIPTEQYPLNGCFEYQQATALAKQYAGKLDVTYLAVDLRSIRRKRKFGSRRYQKDGLNVIELNYPFGAFPQWVQRQIHSLYVRKGMNLYRKLVGEPDVIHAHFLMMGYAAGKNRKMFPHAKFVITEHFSGVLKDYADGTVAVERETYDRADHVIAVSPALAKIVGELSCTPVSYIPNMVNSSSFYLDKAGESSPGQFHFLSVGNLIDGKNFASPIEAFCSSFGPNDPVSYSIIGEGEERKKLAELIASNGRQHQIKLLGAKQNAEVAEYMRQADCFVLSSKAETFGVVLVEAAMCGLPLIATDCEGPACIVNDGNGVLVPVDDVNAMARAMTNMVSNYARYDQMAIAKDAVSRFDTTSVAKEIVDLYSTLTIR